MKIKRIILPLGVRGLLLCLITNLAFGQTVKEQLADSKIEKVTVFLSGAQIVRMAKIAVASGKTEIRFNRITPYLDVNSIQVKSFSCVTD